MFDWLLELLQKLIDLIREWLGIDEMTAPAYTTDLTTVDQAQGTGSGLWAEPTATSWDVGGSPAQDVDYPYIQTGTGSYHSVLQATTKSGIAGLMVDGGASGITLPTDGAFLVWQLMYSPPLLDSYANGGLRVMAGNALNAFYWWPIGGNNTGRNPYGGWQNWAFNPAQTTGRQSAGSPSGTPRYFGCAANLTAGIGKGYPHIVDVARWGRCEARFATGESGDPANFTGFAAVNDAATARWGLLQAIPGGFLWKGLMTIGYGGACYFTDSNKIIFIDDTRCVTTAFNKIDIKNASSTVNWTGILFLNTAPSTTLSKGQLEVVDDCDVNISGCTFVDMDTFIFKAASDVLSSVFRRCNTITANDAKFAGTLFDSGSVAENTSQLVWDVNTDPSTDLSGCTFIKGANAHHAIEFGTTSPTSMTLTNVTFSGFSASNGQNDSAVHIKRTSGTVTLTITGGTSPSYKAEGTTTVVIVTSSRTIKAIVQKADGTKIASARVFLQTGADATGGFPYDDSVTIVNSGTTATVTHNGHGMATNDKIVVRSASIAANNGVFTITRTDDNTYTYTMASSPGSNPTGAKVSFVFLEGTTDGSGEISMSRAIGADQTVMGWARKSSAAPYYKEGPLGGTVITSGNSTFTAVLSPDD